MTITSEIQSLNPTAMIDLYVLDAGKQGGPILYFHAGTNELMGNVIWQGNEYIRLPITATGFEKKNSGALPRPIVQISNINGLMAADARNFGYFLGCKFIRKRTFARFLDAVNFSAGNPNADPNQSLSDEIWYVDRKSNETSVLLEFELASSLELQGVGLPRRQFIQNTCAWVYRSPECSYNGPPVALSDDITPTGDASLDQCGRSLAGCKLRFPNTLPFGGFPGCGLIG